MSFKEYYQDQMDLLPRSVHDYLEEGHLAKVVNGVVEVLDLEVLYRRYSERGCSAYDPRMMTKVLFYGTATGDRSSRKMGYRLHSDLAYMYLSGHQEPDFRTLNRFRKDHLDVLPDLFAQMVRMCREMGMVHVGILALDGTKLKANASYQRTKGKEELAKEMAKILEEMEQVDQHEDGAYGEEVNPYETPKALQDEKELKKRLEEAKNKLESEEKQRINLTDFDANIMIHSGHVPHPSYNGGVAVEGSHGVIVAATISTVSSDIPAVVELVEQAERNVGETPQAVVADSGHSSVANLVYLEEKHIEGYIPDPQRESIRRGTKKNPTFHKGQFQYNAQRDTYTCPMGQELHYYRTEKGKGVRRYRTSQCVECLARLECTRAPLRTISRSPYEEILEKRNQRVSTPVGKRISKKRKGLVEPIFGHLKHNLKYRDVLLRGKAKVTGEFYLMGIGYNLRKMANYLAKTVLSPRDVLQPA